MYQCEFYPRNKPPTHSHIYIGSRNGTFASSLKYQINAGANSLLLRDLNNDAHLDVIVVKSGKNSTAAVLLGYGNGFFANPVLYTLGYDITSSRIGDVNNDGLSDLVWRCSYSTRYRCR